MRHLSRGTIAVLIALSILWPAAPTSAGDTYQGKWKGQLSEKEQIILRVNSANEITRVLVDFMAFGSGFCHQGLLVRLHDKGLSVPIDDDAFAFEAKDDSITAKIRGTFSSAKKVAGRVKASVYSVVGGTIYCDADENFGWKAHKL